MKLPSSTRLHPLRIDYTVYSLFLRSSMNSHALYLPVIVLSHYSPISFSLLVISQRSFWTALRLWATKALHRNDSIHRPAAVCPWVHLRFQSACECSCCCIHSGADCKFVCCRANSHCYSSIMLVLLRMHVLLAVVARGSYSGCKLGF